MSANRAIGERGIFFDGHTSFPWTVLGVHIAAAIAILAWSIFWSTLLFGALKYTKMLRVSTEMEFKGMDLVKHGEAAYPAGAWVEYQYNKTDKSKAKEGEATNPRSTWCSPPLSSACPCPPCSQATCSTPPSPSSILSAPSSSSCPACTSCMFEASPWEILLAGVSVSLGPTQLGTKM